VRDRAESRAERGRTRFRGFAPWQQVLTGPWDLCVDFTGTDRSALATALSRARERVTFGWVRRNRMRGTPHYAIGLVTLVPIVVLILVRGDIATLGALYAFGLLGAFMLTSIGMDIVRLRDRADRRRGVDPDRAVADATTRAADAPEPTGTWTHSSMNLLLGFLTTLLVVVAWSTNLVAKPLATAFGGSAAIVGMGIAPCGSATPEARTQTSGDNGVEPHFQRVLAVLAGADAKEHDAVIQLALAHAPPAGLAGKEGIVFLYLGDQRALEPPGVFRLVEAHLHDPHASTTLGRANYLARAMATPARFVYRHQEVEAVRRVVQFLRPQDCSRTAVANVHCLL
jgi:hypothetical protein